MEISAADIDTARRLISAQSRDSTILRPRAQHHLHPLLAEWFKTILELRQSPSRPLSQFQNQSLLLSPCLITQILSLCTGICPALQAKTMTQNFECSGIGVGARCGRAADVILKSHKWNSEKETIEEIVVHVCSEHAAELQRAMADKRRCLTPNHSA